MAEKAHWTEQFSSFLDQIQMGYLKKKHQGLCCGELHKLRQLLTKAAWDDLLFCPYCGETINKEEE